MSIQELGNIGEFLGSLAVLATLIYLGVQTRQTKQIATGDAARNVIVDFQHLWSALSETDEFTSLVRRGVNDWPSLNKTEQLRVHSFFIHLVIHFESALSQEYLPDLKEMVAAWEDNLLGLIQSPGGREWYDTCQYLFASTLRDRINGRLSRPDSLPPAWPATLPWWGLDVHDSKAAAV
jgi:hypothetical protein